MTSRSTCPLVPGTAFFLLVHFTPPARAIYIIARLAVLSTVLAMSAGMINQEGVNVDLYIPRKCAAVPV